MKKILMSILLLGLCCSISTMAISDNLRIKAKNPLLEEDFFGTGISNVYQTMGSVDLNFFRKMQYGSANNLKLDFTVSFNQGRLSGSFKHCIPVSETENTIQLQCSGKVSFSKKVLQKYKKTELGQDVNIYFDNLNNSMVISSKDFTLTSTKILYPICKTSPNHVCTFS